MRWWKLPLFASVPALVLLAGLELWARRSVPLLLPPNMAPPASMHQGPAPCFQPDLYAGYTPVGGSCGRNPEGFYSHSTGPAAPGVVRVLVLGDSVAENFLHADPLRDALAPGAAGKQVEVWNAGVSGYDTCTELQVLERRGLAADPDVVLLFFTVNDLSPSASVLHRPDGKVELVGGGKSWIMPGWMIHSRLLTWMSVRLAGSRAWEPGPDSGYSEACYERMVARAAQEGLPLRTVLFPALLTDSPEVRSTSAVGGLLTEEDRIRKLLARVGVPWLDLRPGLSEGGPIERFGRGDADAIHPSGEGAELAARLIGGWVVGQGVLAER